MSKTSFNLCAIVLVAAIGLTAACLPLWAGPSDSAIPLKSNKIELHQKASANLALALTAMDEASKALAAGDKDKTKAELEKARKLVQETQDAFLKYAPGVKK